MHSEPTTTLHDVDWLTIKKNLADLAQVERKKARDAKSLALSDDRATALHREYWHQLESRHSAAADVYDTLRLSLKDATDAQ